MAKNRQSELPSELIHLFDRSNEPTATPSSAPSTTEAPSSSTIQRESYIRGRRDSPSELQFEEDEYEVVDGKRVPVVRKGYYDDPNTGEPVQGLCKVLGYYKPEQRYFSLRARYIEQKAFKKLDYLDSQWVQRGKNMLNTLYPWPPAKIFYSWGYYKFKSDPQSREERAKTIYKESGDIYLNTVDDIKDPDDDMQTKHHKKKRNTYIEEYIEVDDYPDGKKKKHKKEPHYVVTEEVIWVDDDTYPAKKKKKKKDRTVTVTEEIIEVPYGETKPPKKLNKKRGSVVTITEEIIEIPSEAKPIKKKKKKDPIITVTEEIIEIPINADPRKSFSVKKKKSMKGGNVTVTEELIELPSTSNKSDESARKKKKKSLAAPSTNAMVFDSFEDDAKKDGKKKKTWF